MGCSKVFEERGIGLRSLTEAIDTTTAGGKSGRAAEMHGTLLASGERTCIDCHKGIAHKLPDMTGVPGSDVSMAN